MILDVTSLGIRRSERWIFRALSFQLQAGEIIQVVGPNGSGKTSLLRALCGLLHIAEGRVVWGSSDNIVLPFYQGHLSAIKSELTVFENLKLHPLGGKFFADEQIDEAIGAVELSGYEDEPARRLSAGQIRRVGLARLLLTDSPCWVLDEPFTSLDIAGCSWLEHEIERYVNAGNSVLITSHQKMNLTIAPRIIELQQCSSQADRVAADNLVVTD